MTRDEAINHLLGMEGACANEYYGEYTEAGFEAAEELVAVFATLGVSRTELEAAGTQSLLERADRTAPLWP